MPAQLSVALVDDDLSVRRALVRLLSAGGYEARAFASAQELIDSNACADVSCLVLDVHLGGGSTGFALAERLAAAGTRTPIVFITAHDDAAARARAARLGAGYLRKPFEASALLDAVQSRARGEGS